MQLDFDFGIFLHHFMKLLSIQGKHVTVCERPGGEDGREELLVVAYVLCCMATYLHSQPIILISHSRLEST